MRERCGKSMAALLFGAMLFVGAKSGAPPTVHGFEWVPSPEEIQKYRRSWNPFSHGPILNTGVDIQPKGQYLFQPFVFGQVGHEQYGNKLTTDSSDAQTHLRAVAPTLIFAYGITNHVELNVAPSWVWFRSEERRVGKDGRSEWRPDA